jgi:hypothetical protein
MQGDAIFSDIKTSWRFLFLERRVRQHAARSTMLR